MFAFAIYNIHTKALFIARDNFLELNHYFIQLLKIISFASEIKALFEYPGVVKKI